MRVYLERVEVLVTQWQSEVAVQVNSLAQDSILW